MKAGNTLSFNTNDLYDEVVEDLIENVTVDYQRRLSTNHQQMAWQHQNCHRQHLRK
jgi:hypothetical protein